MTVRISVNVEEDVKQGAQRILGEIGMDMTTAIDSFLRTLIREERIPFELRTERAYQEAAHRGYILSALAEAEPEAADPNTRWLSHSEVMASLSEQRKAATRV